MSYAEELLLLGVQSLHGSCHSVFLTLRGLLGALLQNSACSRPKLVVCVLYASLIDGRQLSSETGCKVSSVHEAHAGSTSGPQARVQLRWTPHTVTDNGGSA